MVNCPHCKSNEKQVKAGKTKVGSQRYKCPFCQRLYTPEPKLQGYPDELRHQAIQLYLNGMNLRYIGRELGLDHKTVSRWLMAHTAQSTEPVRPANENAIEFFPSLDEKKRQSSS